MKSGNIENVVNRLINSKESAILISGPWGIGKTYEIKEYIKTKEEDIKLKKIKIAYSSLFGKNSIDEVNTELYQIFHPAKKILKTITNVAKLINVGVGLPCGINLSIDDEKIKINNKVKANNKNVSLIILDDFERKSDNITAEELLGFINNLINQGFKVVVLADLDTEFGKKNKKYEIGKIENEQEIIANYISKINFSDDILGFYKEKIFDRIYNITETPEEVIKTIFGDNAKYINDKILLEFDSNIRMAIKANSLFLQIEKYIKEKNYPCEKFDVIMKMCIYSVKELMTGKYLKDYNEKYKTYKYLKYSTKSLGNIISSYDNSLKDDIDLIEEINQIYLNENYQILQSCFYGSDESKIEIIKKQYDLILSIPVDFNYNHSRVNQFIRDWYCYAYYLDLSFIDKEKLFKKLNDIKFRMDSFGEDNKKFIELIEEYREYCDNQKKYSLIELLSVDDLKKLKFGLYEISREYRSLDDESKKYLKRYLMDNNFFLQKIDGDINESLWEINHLVCRIINEDIPDLKECLLATLNTIRKEHNKDLSCAYRIDSLINQYNLDIKKEED